MENMIDFREMESIPAEDREALARRINRYLELRERARAIEEEQREARDQIMLDLSRLGLEKTRYEAYTVQVRRVERRTLDRERLIELGVSPSVIREAEQVNVSLQLDIRESRKPAAREKSR